MKISLKTWETDQDGTRNRMGFPRVTKERPSYPFRSLRVKYKGQLRMFLTRFRYRGIVRCCIIGADEIMNLEYSELSMRPSPRDFSSKLCLRCACRGAGPRALRTSQKG